jgi:hypothetical protein
MTSKKKAPEAEFDISETIDDTPVTSDGDICSCSSEKGRDIYCTLHGG